MSWAERAAVTLENDRVQLRPLRAQDASALHDIALDDRIWRYSVTVIRDDAQFDAWFTNSLAQQAAGRKVVFCITDKSVGRVAGSMSFANFAETDRRLEIGSSWLGTAFQGQGVNRWAKFLMLQHAFESLGAERVEFKTDVLNLQARHGLRNIGAVEEGVLRSYNVMPGGRRRDAIFYSVLRAEWPGVKQELATRAKISRPVPVGTVEPARDAARP